MKGPNKAAFNTTCRAVFSGLLTLSLCIGCEAQYSKPQKVDVRFVDSPSGDYLLYLLFRSTGRYTDLEQRVSMNGIPTLEERISLPETAESSDIAQYSQLYRLLEPYQLADGRRVVLMPGSVPRYRILAYSYELPSYQKLRSLIDQGAKEYPLFEKYWHQNIEPDERKQIAIWKDQANQWHPFDGLQSLARLRFPVGKVDIAAMALHGSGSANTDPEGIYSTLAVRNVAWMVGHEGTHLLVDEYGGNNWRGRPGAEQVIQLAIRQGATGDDIEEALCMLMQVKLSVFYAQTPADFRISSKLPPSVKRDILVALEDDWPSYQSNTQQDLMDWLIKCAQRALSRSSETAK